MGSASKLQLMLGALLCRAEGPKDVFEVFTGQLSSQKPGQRQGISISQHTTLIRHRRVPLQPQRCRKPSWSHRPAPVHISMQEASLLSKPSTSDGVPQLKPSQPIPPAPYPSVRTEPSEDAAGPHLPLPLYWGVNCLMAKGSDS